jgi:hypothetical protein
LVKMRYRWKQRAPSKSHQKARVGDGGTPNLVGEHIPGFLLNQNGKYTELIVSVQNASQNSVLRHRWTVTLEV